MENYPCWQCDYWRTSGCKRELDRDNDRKCNGFKRHVYRGDPLHIGKDSRMMKRHGSR
jgi:DNA primase large subunit